MEKSYYVYLITNKHLNVLYTGVTNNLIRRIHDHRNKSIKGFSKKYQVYRLVYYETCASIIAAITREKQIKNWSRAKKEELINKLNPNWLDLYEELIR